MRFSTLAITTLVATTHPTQAQESPVAIEDYIHTDLNQLIYIPVLANDLTGHYTLPLSVRQVITNDVNGVDTSAQHGVCVLAPNHYGVLYEPDANYNGYDYCHYQVCDGRGPPFCDEAQITIHVGPHNESDSPTRKPNTSPTITSPSATTMPVAKNDSATLINNQQIIVNVLANDIRGDPDLPLSVRQIIANEPINTLHNALNGVCAVSPNRLSVIYTPNVGFVGTDSCQYEACDERGPSFCDVASITFTVAALAVTIEPTDVPTRKPTNLPTNIPTRNPTNKPTANPASVPVAINDFRTMTNTINASSLRINVLVNDVQGNPNFPLSVNSILTDADNDADSTNFPIALNGICAISQDHLAVLYTPNDGFDGIDRCAYRMCDSRGEAYCDEAVVQVTVDAPTPINKPTPRPTMSPTNFSAPSISNKPTRNPANPNSMPIAVKDSVTLDVNQVVRVAVLGNDILGDAAYAPLRVLRIVQNDFNALHNALNGLCTVSGNRLAVVYTPNAGFDGVDRCTYEMCDNRGEPFCDTATVTFFVESTNINTIFPTMSPTLEPTLSPTLAPTLSPTLVPSLSPTLSPTVNPTVYPTFSPTFIPTISPTLIPNISPTLIPTTSPTILEELPETPTHLGGSSGKNTIANNIQINIKNESKNQNTNQSKNNLKNENKINLNGEDI